MARRNVQCVVRVLWHLHGRIFSYVNVSNLGAAHMISSAFLSSVARAPLCRLTASGRFTSARTRIRWLFACLVCVSVTTTRPCTLRTRHHCGHRHQCVHRLPAIDHEDGFTELCVLIWKSTFRQHVRVNVHASLYCLVGFRTVRFHAVVNLRWGGRCSRHNHTSSVSKACSLAVSMFWQAPRRTQNHWNRRRRVVGKTGSDIQAAITWMSVRLKGQLL